MKRNRFQKGSLQKLKFRGRLIWRAQWREPGCKGPRTRILGTCREVTKSQAQEQLAAILSDLRERIAAAREPAQQSPQEPVMTFAAYVRDCYLPVRKLHWKASTYMTTPGLIETHLIPALGDRPIDDIRNGEVQALLDQKIERGVALSTVRRIRAQVQKILRLAAADLRLPAFPLELVVSGRNSKPAKPKRTLSDDEIDRLAAALDLRERIMFRLGVTEGLRIGETFALQVGDIKFGVRSGDAEGDWVVIRRRVYRGNIDTPKTHGGDVPLSKRTAGLIRLWLEMLPDRRPEAWLFPSEQGTPLSPYNVWLRNILPHVRRLGLDWATPHRWRATQGTRLHVAGVDPKVSAAMRRHGLGVSLEHYVEVPMLERIQAMRLLEGETIQ